MDRRIQNAAIVGYLLFQIGYPVRGLLADKFETWGEFTWNMYSQTYDCWSRYRRFTEARGGEDLDIHPYFQVASRIPHVMNREVLPSFHAFLCREAERGGQPVRILGQVTCVRNGNDRRELVRPGQDICSAADHAVIMD